MGRLAKVDEFRLHRPITQLMHHEIRRFDIPVNDSHLVQYQYALEYLFHQTHYLKGV